MQPFTDLHVWQRSHQLALAVYRGTKTFPDDERFGMTVQLRRAAVSVPSNIAEGAGRRSPADFRRCLDIASGSLAECRSLLLLARDLEYLAARTARTLLDEAEQISRMLYILMERIRDGKPPRPVASDAATDD